MLSSVNDIDDCMHFDQGNWSGMTATQTYRKNLSWQYKHRAIYL